MHIPRKPHTPRRPRYRTAAQLLDLVGDICEDGRLDEQARKDAEELAIDHGLRLDDARCLSIWLRQRATCR